jgi:hypothetical protein
LKISICNYELKNRDQYLKYFSNINLNGALLKIEWPGGLVGYSDLLPQVFLNEGTLKDSLDHLKKMRMSHLLEQAIWLANSDGEARRKMQSLFEGQKRIKNCFPIYGPDDPSIKELNLLKSSGFSTVSLLVGRDPEAECEVIHRITQQYSMMVRLDFRMSATHKAFERIFSKLESREKALIECAIDPVPYDLTTWKEMAKICVLALRDDFHKVNWQDAVPFRIMMLDPYRKDVNEFIKTAKEKMQKVIVYTYNRHALSVSQCLIIAAKVKDEFEHLMLDADCFHIRPFALDNFFQNLRFRGPYLDNALGHGVGFDILLERLTWQRLI